MDWATARDIAESATAVAWLTLAASGLGWLLRTWAQRRVRVRGLVGVSRTLDWRTGEPIDHGLTFVLFNNLGTDVGVHDVTLSLQQPGQGTRHIAPPLVHPFPETIKAQHSLALEIREKDLPGSGAAAAEAVPTTRCRVTVALGNGSLVTSRWVDLPRKSGSPGSSSG